MEFEHEAHWTLYQEVRDFLARELGEDAAPIDDDDPSFAVTIGANPLIVAVQAAGPRACLTIYGRAAEGLDITPEVADLLLRANFGHDVPFGSFGLNDENDISFSHVLMAEAIDVDSLSLLLHLLSNKLDDVQAALARSSD
jgi:hypothetical protein